MISRYFSKTILSSVKVPVLSVHKIFIAPKFWIESNFFTIVFFLDILTAPFERLEDKITGKSKGVIAMAIATANVKAVTISCFHAFKRKITGISISIKWINNLLIFSIPFWNAVLGLPVVNVWAIFPKYVESAVLITTPLALPEITFVPIKQIVSKSEILSILFKDILESTYFSTLSDSPVREDCPTYKSFASMILKSAGIMLPAESTTMSPSVTWFIGIWISFPSRITVVFVATICFNSSAALLERYSSTKSNNVLAVTKIAITIIFA